MEWAEEGVVGQAGQEARLQLTMVTGSMNRGQRQKEHSGHWHSEHPQTGSRSQRWWMFRSAGRRGSY